MKPETYRLERPEEIISPALIYYRDIIEQNIRRMIDIAGDEDRLWPHVKSHKSSDMVRLLMRVGIRRFKCATIAECEMTGLCGAAHVLLAYPLVGPNIARFLALVKTFPRTVFYAIGDDEGQLTLLSDAAQRAGIRVNLLLDIDDGLHRTGISISGAGKLYRSAAAMPGLRVCGMHVYDGHRHESSAAQRRQRVEEDAEAVYALQKQLINEGMNCSIMVMGGTPSFPCHAGRPGVFLSPGTCMIQDYGYRSAFPDLPFEVGAMLLTRVVSHPQPDAFTVDLGYKAVAADPEQPRAVILGYEDARTVMQNEEHWVLRMPEGRAAERPAIGTVLYAAPRHICPTTALYPSILVAHDGQIEAEWPVTARNRRITL